MFLVETLGEKGSSYSYIRITVFQILDRVLLAAPTHNTLTNSYEFLRFFRMETAFSEPRKGINIALLSLDLQSSGKSALDEL